MSLSFLQAQAACIALVVIDAATRAARLQVLVRTFGHSLGAWDALRANVVEDAAAGLTPMRIGGQPARMAMLARAGVPASTIITASVAEAAIMYPVVIAAAAAVAVAFAPDWWSTAGANVVRSAASAGRWLALAFALALVAWFAMRRLLPHHHHSARRTLVHAWHELRRAGPRAVAWSALLSLASVAARVAILPLLAATLPQHPEFGVIVLASFAFLYGQLLLPTPSGAGVVELGFLAGGTGVGGAGAGGLLLAWRIYTTLLGVGAGILAALGAGGAAWRQRNQRRAANLLAGRATVTRGVPHVGNDDTSA